MKNILIFIIILLSICLLNKRCTPKEAPLPTVIEKTDTLIKKDTITISKPYPVKTTIVDTIYQKVEVIKDSIVKLPIERKTYQDTTYKAIVSGFQPILEHIEVYPKTYTIYKEKNIFKPKKGFYVTPQIGIGYGVFSHKPDVFIGVGISYNF